MKNKELIQQKLNITPDFYATLVEGSGYKWMQRYFANDPAFIMLLARCGTFWKWWVNQWDIRDQEYVRITSLKRIDGELQGITLIMAKQLYLDAHNVMGLQVVPNKFVIKEVTKAIAQEEKKIAHEKH